MDKNKNGVEVLSKIAECVRTAFGPCAIGDPRGRGAVRASAGAAVRSGTPTSTYAEALPLRALRANRFFCTDKSDPCRKSGYGKKQDDLRVGFIQDRRLCADMFFIRAQSAIRADGFSSAQNRTCATPGRDPNRHV